MRDVERADYADAVLLERQRVLPALGMGRIPEIVVCQFVEHHNVGLFAQCRVVIEVFEGAIADRDAARWHPRKPRRDAFEIGPAFRFDPADRHALAFGAEAARVFQKAARLPGARRSCNVDDEPRPASEFAQQFLGFRRAIHQGGPFALHQGGPAGRPENAR